MTEHDTPKIDKDIIAKKASHEALEAIGEDAKPELAQSADEIGSDNFFADKEQEEKQVSLNLEQLPGQNVPPGEPEQPAAPIAPQQPEAAKSDETALKKPNIFNPGQLKETLYAKKQLKDKQDSQRQIAQQPLRQTAQSAAAEQQSSSQAMDMAPKAKVISVKNENPGTRDLFGNIKEVEEKLKTTNGYGGNGNYSAKKAEQFFSHEEKEEAKEEIESEKKEKKPVNKKLWATLAVILILLGAVAGIGSWAYVNYPKVNVTLFPKSKDLSKEIKIVAKEGISSSEISEAEIPGRFVEMTLTKTLDFDSTGETYETDDGKARGKVTIRNNYSQATQQLVATTRLLSSEGKLFRLVDDVVVPGMSGEEPGEIEAAVIADKPGEDFNIGPSKFTIEGFKGGPKYTAFEVESQRTMTDGGAPNDNRKMAMVTETDIANARVKTIEALELTLENEIENKIEDDLKVIADSVEKEIESTKPSREPGDVAAKFSYTVNQKIKAIAFYAEDVNFVVMNELERDVEENYVMESVSEVIFKKGIADYENKTLTMYVDAKAVSWPSLDHAEFVEGIAGKNENEIRSFLSGYQDIEKAEISMDPPWLTIMPVSKEKVTIKEQK